MSTSFRHLYCDPESHRQLLERSRQVLLVGGFLGHQSFGDILQLRGVMEWHRMQTGLEPVVVCDIGSITDAGFAEHLREQLAPAVLLFAAANKVDLQEAGLSELSEVPGISHLHVYGGGFLNRDSGAVMLDLIEALCDRFGVGHYVLSGQQVGSEIRDRLIGHFAKYRPRITGARDGQSLEILRGCGVEASDSFDDSMEPLLALVDSLRDESETKRRGALLHMNLWSDARGQSHREVLDRMRGRIRELCRWFEAHEPEGSELTLLQAHGDRRAEVVDTLRVVNELENGFPFSDFRVVDLPQLALADRSSNGHSKPPRLFAELALCSSYHVAVFCGLLGVPCFLQAGNDYFEQKRSGLGLETRDFDAFLANPERIQTDAWLGRRSAWNSRLKSVYEEEPRPANQVPVAAQVAAAPLMPWHPKRGATELLDADQSIRNLELTRDSLLVETERLSKASETNAVRVSELERERDSARAEAERLGALCEQQGAKIRQIELERDGARSECGRLGSECKKQSLLIQQVEAERDDARTHAERLGGQCEQHSVRIRELEAELKLALGQTQQLEAARAQNAAQIEELKTEQEAARSLTAAHTARIQELEIERDLSSANTEHLEEQREQNALRIQELEAERQLSRAEAERLTGLCQQHNERIHELDVEQKVAQAETERLGKLCEEQRARVQQIEAERDDARTHAERLGGQCEQHIVRVRELEEARERVSAESERVAKLWEVSSARNRELEEARDRIGADAERVSKLWEASTGRAQELYELARAAEEIASVNADLVGLYRDRDRGFLMRSLLALRLLGPIPRRERRS